MFVVKTLYIGKSSPCLMISWASMTRDRSSSSCSQRRYVDPQHGQTKRISEVSFSLRDSICSFEGGSLHTGRLSIQSESIICLLHARQGILVAFNSSRRNACKARIFRSCFLIRVPTSLSTDIPKLLHQKNFSIANHTTL